MVFFHDFSHAVATDSLTCSAEVYTGAVCLAPLQVWQSCIPDRAGSTDIFIVDRPGVPQEAIESEFTSFLTMFSIVSPSAECQAATLPFYCLMNFGLCGNDSRSYLPTSQQCLELTVACESEFQLIGASQPELIPDCTALPDTGIDCSCEYTVTVTELIEDFLLHVHVCVWGKRRDINTKIRVHVHVCPR